jgi:hypothetical protein
MSCGLALLHDTTARRYSRIYRAEKILDRDAMHSIALHPDVEGCAQSTAFVASTGLKTTTMSVSVP